MKKPLTLLLALGLALAGGSWWRLRRQASAPSASPSAKALYICPMRCLQGKTYAAPGPCPVCGMALVPVAGTGVPKRVQTSLWPALDGKTAVFFRPYEVRALPVQRSIRVAGALAKGGRELNASLEPLEAAWVRKGQSCMLWPVAGQVRAVLGSVAGSPKGMVRLLASRPLAGTAWAIAEILAATDPVLAVPVEAVDLRGDSPVVYALEGRAYRPRPVSLGVWGDRFVEIKGGVKEGDTIAGSGLFWLKAEQALNRSTSPL